jgi:hypothetical protein
VRTQARRERAEADMTTVRLVKSRRAPLQGAASTTQRRSAETPAIDIRGTPGWTDDALDHSPRAAAQRQRLAAAFGAAVLERAGGVPRACRAGTAAAPARGSCAVQGMFQHQGRKKKAEQYDARSPALPKIHGVSERDLRALAEDAYDYGAIENQQDFERVWAVFQENHRPAPEQDGPLEELQSGNVTVLELEEMEQAVYDGTVRLTMQIDWLQGKHDQPFMSKNSSENPRKMQDTQMRLSLDRYRDLAGGAPLELLNARLDDLFAQPERTALDFAVMGNQQSDLLYYEISAMWTTTGDNERHVLVYYHCFPDKKDQKTFGYGK